jgi:hypothetical protein
MPLKNFSPPAKARGSRVNNIHVEVDLPCPILYEKLPKRITEIPAQAFTMEDLTDANQRDVSPY